MFKTFDQTLKYLSQQIIPPGSAHNPMRLDRIQKLCELLGNPQNAYPIIHIGGTSGKGSTATFAAEILKRLGLKTGLHTSPHLESVTERIQTNEKPISETEFVSVLNTIYPHIEQIAQMDFGHPTYFEILVALAFCWFRKQRVDAAVIEVGLGGTFDGTNIINSTVAVLTNVSLDHTNILGKTVSKIAKDKMGIIKESTQLVVSGFTQPLLQRMLINKCAQLNKPLKLLNRDFSLTQLSPSLPGEFQKLNFTLAEQAVKEFVEIEFPKLKSKLNHASLEAAIHAFIPGRFEIMQNKPLMILDGAHNKAKMAALVLSLKKLYPDSRWLVVFALKKDKPARQLLQLLDPITLKYFFTGFNMQTDFGTQQTTPAHEFAKLTHKPMSLHSSAQDAVLAARREAKIKNQPLLVTGSLYLVGEVRHLFTPIQSGFIAKTKF